MMATADELSRTAVAIVPVRTAASRFVVSRPMMRFIRSPAAPVRPSESMLTPSRKTASPAAKPSPMAIKSGDRVMALLVQKGVRPRALEQ